ncbi:centrosomal protein of 164 kDa [Suncus etruscus]|uniref:centrosomal protein of 164 kDa n=1 Tax=Suncus etruscus TaxID=109475 RepID=UPI00210F890B|nr:centrosomal protein of 164 kDa [Suncus etruscus]
MAGRPIRIGDQLVLEEDYDETYIPSEQEILEFAREIGIDPIKEPELMWLAREGIVAPLPMEWKPCQDITGDIYYFNFSNGQSMWDHPCDEHYRSLVIQERGKLSGSGATKKKDKKKKKEKKDKKDKGTTKNALALGAPLALTHIPPGGLAPLRGLGDGAPAKLKRMPSENLGSLTESEQPGDLQQALKASAYPKGLLGSIHEDKIALGLLGLEEEAPEEDEADGDLQSGRSSSDLLKNLHLDIGALGSDFAYESPQTSQLEKKDTSRGSEATGPPLPVKLSCQGADSSLGSASSKGSKGSSGRGQSACIPEKERSEKNEAGTLRSLGTPDPDPGSHQPAQASTREIPESPGDAGKEGSRNEEEAKVSSHPRASLSDVSEDLSEHVEKLRLSGDSSDPKSFLGPDLGFRSQTPEHLLGIHQLTPALNRDSWEPHRVGRDKDGGQSGREEWQSQLTRGSESRSSKLPLSSLHSRTPEEQPPEQERAGRPVDAAGSPLPLVSLQREEETPSLPGSLLWAQEQRLQAEEPEKGPACLSSPSACPEVQPTVPSPVATPGLLPETMAQELEREERRLLELRHEKLQQLREKLQQEEEEEMQKLRQQQESSLSTLKEQLRRVACEEERRLREEEDQKLAQLRVQIQSNTAADESQLRAQQEVALQRLKDELELQKEAQRACLEQQNRQALEQLREEMEAATQRERTFLSTEKEQALKQLQEQLEGERRGAVAALERTHQAKLDRLSNSWESEHREVASGFRKQMEEVQPPEGEQQLEKLSRAELLAWQKAQHIREYEHELSSLLREKRQEVEREHERKMEKIRQEHRQVLAETREQYEAEERKQRTELLGHHTRELERLHRSHERDLELLWREQEQKLEDARRCTREQEKKLQDLEAELESRTKDVKARLAELDVQEAAARKEKQQLLNKQRQMALEHEEASSTQQHLEEARKEHDHLLESRRQLHRALEELRACKFELEAQVDLLRGQSQRLQKQVSDLEAEVQRKQAALKGLDAQETNSVPSFQPSLCLEDLQQSLGVNRSKEATPSLPNKESPGSSLTSIQHCLSAEGMALHNAREFLARQARSMRRRQTALKAQQQYWRHELADRQDKSSEPPCSKSLEEAASTPLASDNTPEGSPTKKTVTFDLSDSEDSSMDSSESFLPSQPPLPQSIPHHRIQSLHRNLQHISSQLSGVLGMLVSLDPSLPHLTSTPLQPQAPMAACPTLLSTSSSTALTSTQWAWALRSPLSSVTQTVDDFLVEKWHKYFPTGVPFFSCGSASQGNRLGYVSASEQLRLLQRSHPRVPEVGGSNLEDMLEANRKWLRWYKNDPKSQLFPVPKPTTSSRLLQLGLDQQNKLNVHYY